MNCPICNHESSFICQVNHHCDRDFYECKNCYFCFVPIAQHLSENAEYDRYINHNNSAEDLNYQIYMRSVLDPFFHFYQKNLGLKTHIDYGSGNSLTAVLIMKEAGFESHAYDPYFFPVNPAHAVDVITCIEVIEHFRNPLKNFEEMLTFLKPNGFLMARTLVWQKQGNKEFENWWYKNDPTHISLFTEESFRELESRFPIKREYFDGKSTIIWKKVN